MQKSEAKLPKKLTEEDGVFLREYVDNGGHLQDAMLEAYGDEYNSEQTRRAKRLLTRPDARAYMHRLRVEHGCRLFQSAEDLVVELEYLVSDPRTKTKYKLQALQLLTRILVARKTESVHTINVDTTFSGLSEGDIKRLRSQVIGIDADLVSLEAKENDVRQVALSILPAKKTE